jgi:mono/diheme cytochrome c family protein
MRAAAALLLLLSGCNNMVQQPRYDDFEQGSLFSDGKVMQPPPAGTVALGSDTGPSATRRPPMSLALVERGQQRFGIYCAPCHGYSGDGDGVIVSRGFPHPPSYHSQRLRDAPDAHFYDVISNGYGAMFSYSDRVAPGDRWAITAYIRALQQTRMQREAGNGG